MGEYEILDHTADLGIRVRARSLENLFETAARAMFDIISCGKKSSNSLRLRKKDIILEDVGLEELLVSWLGELLSLSACEGLIFTEFNIEDVGSQRLKASVAGADKKHFEIIREIKAVTYHQLKIGQMKDQYFAEIIFDL